MAGSEAFGIHINSVSNYISAFMGDGVNGLLSRKRGPKESWKITPEIRFKILEIAFSNKNVSYDDLVKLVKEKWGKEVGIRSICRILSENGFMNQSAKEQSRESESCLFEIENTNQLSFHDLEKRCKNFSDTQNIYSRETACSEEKCNKDKEIAAIETNIDEGCVDKKTSAYSSAERNYLNRLERGEFSAYAGGLLFVSLLRQYHFASTIEKVIGITTCEGYSLEQLCLTILYCDVFGFRSIENFKTVYPEEFGILIGKLYSPSIFTIRRFLHKIRELKNGEQLMEEFGKEYLSQGLVKWGVLYIDSHFLPYYGICLISMGWHGVKQKPMKGSYNFLAVDDKFNPLIFFIRPSSEDLLKKIPELILKAKGMAKSVGMPDEKLIVVFDREGYSSELFREMDSDQLKTRFITWAKYFDSWKPEIKEEQFRGRVIVNYEIQKSEEIKYFEAENRTMKKYGKIRAIVIQSGRKKKQTAIYTNDWEIPAGLVIQLICRRWGQETLIKTLKLDHRIDYFPGYEYEELEKQPMVGNPITQELKRSRANLVTELHKLKLGFADLLLNKVSDEINWQEVKEKKITTLANIQTIRTQMLLIDQKIDELPAEIKFEEAHNGERLVEFDYEKKRFLDCIKVFSYTMQKAACKILGKYYDDPKDVWQILGMIVRRGADIKLNGNELTIRLKKFRDEVIDYAARHLCEELNEMAPVTLDKFRFQLRYEVT
ncbi:MAG: helix-turn-helix domain-containing protein [Chlamydiae bacterium]|nr:helix-turn-helix domain-containing protein [Chlamydiota bacterium]